LLSKEATKEKKEVNFPKAQGPCPLNRDRSIRNTGEQTAIWSFGLHRREGKLGTANARWVLSWRRVKLLKGKGRGGLYSLNGKEVKAPLTSA